ncbi:E3 ubiquitin-protein ligase PIB1 [Tolypocladium capitatum]|uniref:RING-type E3 ubiquitin transferase n=1 Tax=Tolypocladium capitatum TaxID=45235 RepID=A0A2K3QKH6_9HYPO|nr:E3 ubiquitin-protein ligase PIB1 [Tolypocladium capitatum]
MASPSGHSRPIPISEPAAADDSADSGSRGSYSSGDSLQFSMALCRWRTIEFHDQECSRYFDCPSHILERRSSMDDDQEPRTSGGGPSATSEAHDANEDASGGSIDSADVPSTERTPNDQSHRDAALHESIGSSPGLSTSPEAGIATEAQAQRDEPIILPVRTSSAVGRSNSTASQSGTSRSQPHGIPTPLPDMERAGETYRAAYERLGLPGPLSSPGYPAIESSEESTSHRNYGRSAVQGNQASEVGTSRQIEAQSNDGGSLEFALPRWQPDAEVTYCPICHAQFSIFVRKHHCRKCGRVVCNSCSPHRIIIPHQYIVRPPGSDISMPPSLLLDGLGAGYFDVNGPSGGERVRLCNPCVPDPNTAPPQSPTSSAGASPRTSHQRSRNSIGSVYGVAPPANRYGAVLTASRGGNAYQYYSPRSRSNTMGPQAHGAEAGSSSHHRVSVAAYQSPLDRFLAVGASGASSASLGTPHSSFGDHASSSRQRALPPPPQIAEEDECPICHQELPSRELPDFEDHRQSHIAMCIQAHSTYSSPRTGNGDTAPPRAPRRTGMYTYAATEKDCIDDAECTICLEEFTVGVPMARLECLCRFHRSCISAWFVNHPGRCPVHQHDGFGF